MSSHGLVIRDRVSDIHTTIFPAIHLDTEKTYEIGLIQFPGSGRPRHVRYPSRSRIADDQRGRGRRWIQIY